MKIILTGATGLIGSRFEELMFEKHEIIPLSSSKGIDITDINSVYNFLYQKNYDVIIHLAGKTDVDACEQDKEEDLSMVGLSDNNILDFDISKLDASKWAGKNSAIAVNTIGTKNLSDIARHSGARFVFISTDFIFSGKDEFYTEESIPFPVDWYGVSKYLGEKMIDNTSHLIVRLSFPYGFLSPVKKDVVWKIHDLLKDREEVSLISDQIITPTFIDDIVNGLDYLITKEAKGIFNLTGSSSLSPKDIGEKIKEKFGFETTILESKLEEIYKDKAPRPFHSIMINDKIKNLGFTPKTFDEGLELIKNNPL